MKYLIINGPDGHLVKAIGPYGEASVYLTPDQFARFEAWANGSDSRPIQRVFPDLSADEREILMTGIGPEQWDKMFKGGEDE